MAYTPGRYFYYNLPEDRIAPRPVAGGRDLARLLVARRSSKGVLEVEDSHFYALSNYLSPPAIVVLNDSSVIPCRFFAKKYHSANLEVEVVLIKRESEHTWTALAKPMKRIKPGDRLKLSDSIDAQVLGRTETNDQIRLQLEAVNTGCEVDDLVQQSGLMPIPPYIRQGRSDAQDREDYQTIYARESGSIAAPTAGLHFTEQLFGRLRDSGFELGYLTLHVGLASIFPVSRKPEASSSDVSKEKYRISTELVSRIEAVKAAGGKVIAVGTTTCRALESAWQEGKFDSDVDTDLMIKPGYEFLVVDELITNFHQPGSTHLLLVAALIGEEQTDAIYSHALSSGYRFLSYGDAMLLQPEG